MILQPITAINHLWCGKPTCHTWAFYGNEARKEKAEGMCTTSLNVKRCNKYYAFAHQSENTSWGTSSGTENGLKE